MSPDLILYVSIGVFSFSLAWIVLSSLSPNKGRSSGQMGKRIDRISGRATSNSPASSASQSSRAFVKQNDQGFLSLKVIRSFFPRADLLQRRFERAGLNWSIQDGVVVWLIFGGIVATLLFMFVGLNILLSALGGATLALILLSFYIKRRTAQRAIAFVALFPTAIELIVRSVKSGLPISEAIAAIGTEIQEPVGSIFQEISGNLQIGMELTDALWAASRKLDLQEFKFLPSA